MTQLITLDQRAAVIGQVVNEKRNRNALLLSAPTHLPLAAKERLIAVALSNICYNSALLEVALTKPGLVSLFAGIQETMRLGIEIGGSMGESYLVPFRNAKVGAKLAVLIIGYKGMINICERARCDVIAYPVFEGDEYDWAYGDTPHIDHKPGRENPKTRDTLVATYAVARVRGGHKKLRWLWREEIETHRSRSRAADTKDSPWNHPNDYVPMAMKTAVRVIFPMLPKTTDIARALEVDNKADLGEPPTLNEGIFAADQTFELPADLKDEPEDTRSALDKLADAERKAREGPELPPPRGLTDADINWGS
jgi:recombination protein RecT